MTQGRVQKPGKLARGPRTGSTPGGIAGVPVKKAPKGRLAPEMQQEQESLNQIRVWLRHWNKGSYERDLGEDLIVQIYDDEGHWTSLSFNVQVKSTTGLERLLKNGKRDTVPCSLPVKDLKHWEGGSPPVVVLLWDVLLQEGRWLDVPAIIQQLDASTPKWRSQTDVTACLPRMNGTDDAGRKALRHRLGVLALPLHSDKPFKMSGQFVFPSKSANDRAAYEALLRTLDHGDESTVMGEHIRSLKRSPWFDRLFGNSGTVHSITITPTKSEGRLPLQLMAIGPEGTESLSVLLRRVKAGRKSATFSNEAEGEVVRMTLVIEGLNDKGPMRIKSHFGFDMFARGIPEALGLLRFFNALHAGAQVVLSRPGGQPLGAAPIECFTNLPAKNFLAATESFLTKLAYVQLRVAEHGAFNLSEGFTPDDQQTTNQLHSFFTTGSWSSVSDFTLTMTKVPKRLKQSAAGDEGNRTAFEFSDFVVHLLGLRIPLGDVQARLVDPQEFAKAVNAAASKRSKLVKLKDVRVIFTASEPRPETTGPRRQQARQ